MRLLLLLALLGGLGCGGGKGSSSGGPVVALGEAHEGGQYNLGPVDWKQSQWHNACSDYTPAIEEAESSDELLAGLDNSWAADGSLCDVCIQISTPTGKSVVARVVTYGVSQRPNDLDLSPAAYAALSTGEYPRTMTWSLVSCPGDGTLMYQYKSGSNPWWTALWVRNARLPVAKLEVKSANHPDWFALARISDGSLQDDGGFGMGPFSLRVTALTGETVSEDFADFTPGAVVTSAQQLR